MGVGPGRRVGGALSHLGVWGLRLTGRMGPVELGPKRSALEGISCETGVAWPRVLQLVILGGRPVPAGGGERAEALDVEESGEEDHAGVAREGGE